MKNYVNGIEMPMGFGMALAQNVDAMNHFASLTKDEQSRIIGCTHEINSKEEMRAYVRSLLG